MEVILREHVEHLGRRGEIVKVADGYARNYLLPRKLALLATEGNKKQIERERAKLEAQEAEEKKVAEAIADRMANLEVVIARKVGETEALYGSVTTADVAEALTAKGFDIDRRKIQLADPIKKLGDFDLPIKLQREVIATVKVRGGCGRTSRLQTSQVAEPMADVAVAERTLPHNLEAERSVLGAILLHNDALQPCGRGHRLARLLPRRAPSDLRQDGEARGAG